VARAPVTELPENHGSLAKDTNMPFVNIKITREGTGPGRNAPTAEEKARVIQGVSQVLLDVLNKPLDATFVVIEEVELDNWGWQGLPVSELRKRSAAEKK
jgi:4-oxalocrotonate tautomerase